MKGPPPPDDNSPSAIIVRPATQRLIAKEAARLSCRHDFRHDDIVDIQAALRVDLFERLQSLDPRRDHVVLYLLKAMDCAFIDLARTRHRLRRRGDASTLRIDGTEPGFARSCNSFTNADRARAICHQPLDPIEAIDLADAVAVVVASLPPKLASLCRELGKGSHADIRRRLRISRHEFDRRVAEIRAAFAAAGLAPLNSVGRPAPRCRTSQPPTSTSKGASR